MLNIFVLNNDQQSAHEAGYNMGLVSVVWDIIGRNSFLAAKMYSLKVNEKIC